MSRSTVFWDTRCLFDAFRLPEERWTGDVPPQRTRRERKNLSIGHRLLASAPQASERSGRRREVPDGFLSWTSAE